MNFCHVLKTNGFQTDTTTDTHAESLVEELRS